MLKCYLALSRPGGGGGGEEGENFAHGDFH